MLSIRNQPYSTMKAYHSIDLIIVTLQVISKSINEGRSKSYLPEHLESVVYSHRSFSQNLSLS